MKNEKEEERELNVKSYTKLLNFYKIVLEPSFTDIRKNSETLLYDCFTNIFRYNNIVSNNGISFEKISLDTQHIFASICKTSDLDVLTEIKNKDGIKIEEDTDFILESYTYFYIDFKNFGLSVIKTQKIPSADGYIKNLINNNSVINLSIEPFKKSDKEIKDMIINSFSMSFYDNSDNFVELKNIDKNDCEISSFTFSAKLKKVKKNFVSDLLSKYRENKDIKKISVSTDTEEIDLIKNIFTKQVSIQLTKDYKKDFSRIEETLNKELIKIINT